MLTVGRRRLVTSVGAWTYALERAGVLGISAVLPPERRHDVEEETARVLQEAAAGLGADEIGRAKTMFAADFAFDNETNAATTGTLGEFEVVHGGAGRYREILDSLSWQRLERKGTVVPAAEYAVGTVAVTQGSTAIAGTGTTWTTLLMRTPPPSSTTIRAGPCGSALTWRESRRRQFRTSV